jgi:hypothetical protein
MTISIEVYASQIEKRRRLEKEEKSPPPWRAKYGRASAARALCACCAACYAKGCTGSLSGVFLKLEMGEAMESVDLPSLCY